jgi:DNA repair exonuclease SbcCD ATPase subunit
LSKDTNWETDIALIKSDIKQIQKFFTRVEDSMNMMVDLSKNVAVQSEVLEYTKEKLAEVEKLCEDTRRTDELRLTVLSDRLEEDHQKLADHNANKRHNANKEILDRLDSMERSIHQRINEQQKKINNLENWRYYMMGVGFVIVLLVARINWPELFG